MEKALNEIYRVVTASSLFDGHDAAINLFRRILQKAGCEVIHIGHNRSVHQIVTAALQEDAHAVCVSSYQGGHMEFFRYLRDQLDGAGAGDVKIFETILLLQKQNRKNIHVHLKIYIINNFVTSRCPRKYVKCSSFVR